MNINKKTIQEFLYIIFALWFHMFSFALIYFENMSSYVYQIIFSFLVFLVFIQLKLNKIKSGRLVNKFSIIFMLYAIVLLIGGLLSTSFVSIIKVFDFIILLISAKACIESSSVFLQRVSYNYAKIGVAFMIMIIITNIGNEGRSFLGVQANYIGLIAISVSLSSLLIDKMIIRLLIYFISLLLILMVSSRTSLLCLFILLTLDSVFYGRYIFFGFKSWFSKLIITLIYLSCFYLFLIGFLSEVFMLNDEYRGIGTGFSGRDYRWQVALDLWGDNLLFGIGYGLGSSSLGFTVDNAYIAALLETGIIGIFFYIYIFTSSFIISFKNKEMPLLIFLVVYSIYGFFEMRYFNIGNPLSLIFVFIIFKTFTNDGVSYKLVE